MTRTAPQSDPRSVEVLTFALQAALDDLAARAIVAEQHDPDLGVLSATEYRADLQLLHQLLIAIAPDARRPDPEQAAVCWIDGTVYTVIDSRPVAMIPASTQMACGPQAPRSIQAACFPGRQRTHRLAPRCKGRRTSRRWRRGGEC